MMGDTKVTFAAFKFVRDHSISSASKRVAKQSDTKELVPAGFTHQYRALADVCSCMSSGFILLNERDQVTYSNQSALRLLRIGKHDLVAGQEFDVRQHLLSLSADPQQAHSEIARLWETSEQDTSTDIVLADAAVRWLRVRAFPVHDKQDRLLGRGMLFEDITLERVAGESRGEMLATAAHELKTPIAVIKGCATTLLGSSARWDPAMQREMLQMIDAQSDRLHEILNTLLDVWRFDAGTQTLRLSPVQLPELFQQEVTRWLQDAPTHRFILDLPPDVPVVTCDAMRISQVMHHLIDNAVRYSRAGSLVKIGLQANEVEVHVNVSDEGCGIASEHLDRIFDRFYRIREQQGQPDDGSGLGLAASRSVIKAHGGKIWADSEGSGRGSTFYFTLPLTAKAAITAPLPAPGATATLPPVEQNVTRHALLKHDQRVSVLLAESDTRLARYLRANLEEQRYRVQAVSHGLQLLRQLDLEEPDIIILSTHLDDMDSVELLQRLREFSQAPVIMLCDECEEDERVQLFDLGCDDLVAKPFGMKELLARVRALLRRHQTAFTENTTRTSVFTNGDLVIDYAQHIVTVQGRQVQLSRTEYKLLSLLAQNVGMVVTHELLLEKVWGPEYHRDIDFIWVYISRLRRKIEADSRRPQYILTVPDVGYKLAKL